MTLPPLSAEADVPVGWTDRFGDLSRIACHAGVQVLKLAEPAGQGLTFLKVHDEADRGQREGAILRHGLAVVTPRLLLDERSESGQVVLGLDDARQGRDPALRRVPLGALPQAAAVLAKVHEQSAPSAPGAPAWARELHRRASRVSLAGPLQEALGQLLVMGDGLCHQDLHPSNWLCEAGEPVGMLDWASACAADPESDLAGLVLAAGGDPSLIDLVCDSWEGASRGRVADRARVWLLLYLQIVEGAHHKGVGAAGDDLRTLADQLATQWPSQPPLHGSRRVERVVPVSGDRIAGGALWEPVGQDHARLVVDALGRAQRDQPVGLVQRFVGHACNDVLLVNLGTGQRVVKIYNNPVSASLFELEAVLARQLADSGAVVLAPLVLDYGGSLFRVGCRPAALYPYAGDERCGCTPVDRRRLAAAQAALHRVDHRTGPLTDLSSLRPSLPWPDLAAVVSDLFDAGPIAGLHEVWRWTNDGLDEVWDQLPAALVHGSLHRDHAGWWPGRGVVVYDLEKVRVGPRVADVVKTAYFMGYRGNDEQADPPSIVHYLRAYHRHTPLSAIERRAALYLLMECFLHDIKALGQARQPRARMVTHGRLTLEFFRNLTGLREAIAQHLGDR